MRPLIEHSFMDDNKMVVDLKRQVSEFRNSRGWLECDTPRSLAISISIEAAELLEYFQWKNDDQMQDVLVDREERERISEELADVMIYCLGLSEVLAIDVSNAIESKIRKNGEKYPASRPSRRH